MVTVYIKTMLKTIRGTLKIRFDRPQSRLLLLIMLFRFMGNRNILDLVETWGFPKNCTYRTLDEYRASRIQRLVRQAGMAKLVKHLQRLKTALNSIKSQEAITIAVDDFTRSCRGKLGKLAQLWWSGADKKVTTGISGEALVAIIGDGSKEDQVIILDYRLVLPHHDGRGAQPLKKTVWFFNRVCDIEWALNKLDLSLDGCRASMDTAYATQDIKEMLNIFGIQMVSTLHPTRNLITGVFWKLIPIPVKLPAGMFCWLWYYLNNEKMKKMDGESDVYYIRKEVKTNSFGKVVLIALNDKGVVRFHFGGNPKMKTKTIRNTAHRRWKLERVFWSLKQEVGINFHHQKPERGKTRWFLAIITQQALLITAKRFGVSTGKVYREIRRNPQLLLQEICTGITFQDAGSFKLPVHEHLAG